MLLHHDDILLKGSLLHGPAPIAVEFMAVGALEDNALAVDFHQLVLRVEPEFPDADFLGHHFLQVPFSVIDIEDSLVEMRRLGAPKPGPCHRELQFSLLTAGQFLFLLGYKFTIGSKKLHLPGLGCCRIPLHLEPDFPILIIMDRHSLHLKVLDMDCRLGVEQHFPENAGETPEILVQLPEVKR